MSETTQEERDYPKGDHHHLSCKRCMMPFRGPGAVSLCYLCYGTPPMGPRPERVPTDAEMLDWLDSQHNFTVRRAWWSSTPSDIEIWSAKLGDEGREVYGSNLREAIRAAMAAEQKGE